MSRLDDLVTQFLIACTAANLSPKSIEWYRRNLAHFVTFTGDNDFSNPDLLREFIATLYTRQTRYPSHQRHPTIAGGLSPETIRGYIRTLRRFFRWAITEGKLQTDPSKHLPMPKKTKSIPRGISPENFAALVKATSTSKFPTRDRALLFLLRDTGCRTAEIANLQKTDMDLEKGIILVRGKGGKERFAFLSPPTQRIIDEFLKQSNTSDYLFHSRRGHFTTATISQIINRLKRRARITGRTNPHSFRHAFARDYLNAGGNLAALSQTLGHSDLATTMIYAQLSFADLQEQHARYSPLTDRNKS